MKITKIIEGKTIVLNSADKIFDAYTSNTLRQSIYKTCDMYILVDVNQYTIISEQQAMKIIGR